LQQTEKEQERLNALLDQASQELEQQKILREDETERRRVETEDLKQRVEQLQQEREATAVRLEQQKKFYDEEREQRRQRELELLQQKKALQDATGAVRQKEQLVLQQKKLHEDDAARWKSKEQVLGRRVEQLQRDWRNASAKLEQTQRELLQQKRLYQSEQNRAYQSHQAAARRQIISEQNAETAELLDPRPEEDAAPTDHIEAIETEAQRELEEWQNSRQAEQEGIRDPQGEDTSSARKPKFRPRPWMKLR